MMTRHKEECYINLNPLQTGGRTNAAVRMVACQYVDGYAVCDYCKGVLHLIEKPPICDLTRDLAEFLDMDEARITLGAREGKFAVMHALLEPGDAIIFDSNRHYTTYVAAERAGARIYEAPSTGYPAFEITAIIPGDHQGGDKRDWPSTQTRSSYPCRWRLRQSHRCKGHCRSLP